MPSTGNRRPEMLNERFDAVAFVIPKCSNGNLAGERNVSAYDQKIAGVSQT